MSRKKVTAISDKAAKKHKIHKKVKKVNHKPSKGWFNGDPKRVFDKALFTAETQRTQSLLFYLFSFDPAEKSGTCRTRRTNNNMPSLTKNVVHNRVLMCAPTIITAITL